MKLRFAASTLAWSLSTSLAVAAGFPTHADICIDGFVLKDKLAKAIINQNPDASKLYIDASDAGTTAKWQRFFTDDSFCVDDIGCRRPVPGQTVVPGHPPLLDYTVAKAVLKRIRFDFANALQTNVNGEHYSMPDRYVGTDYLLDKNPRNQIACINGELPSKPKPTVLKLPIRVRASSDDLNIDADRDKDQFKSVKPATVSFSRDGVQKSNTTKLQAAIGYAIPLSVDLEKSTTFAYFNGELVPYVSATQTASKVDGKPGTLADTNNVAVGALLTTQTVFNDWSGINNVILAKPQYLWNTKDKSEIASLKFIYQPWSKSINTPIQIGEYLGASWLTFLFDLRNNSGDYTKVAFDPKIAATQRSFDRAGSKFGIAFSTDDGGPHLTVVVTQTLLYGFAGSVKHFDLFESTASYYFDSTSNFAFTVSYSKGRNEDTAENAQTFTAGLSVKF
ncbi:hypothetical protein BH11PSE4_BH11PSE4_01000 [soil metagenome]